MTEDIIEIQDLPTEYLKLILEKYHVATVVYKQDGTKLYGNSAYEKVGQYKSVDDFWIFNLCRNLKDTGYFKGEITLLTPSEVRKEYILHAYTITREDRLHFILYYINITLYNQIQNNFLENERRLNLALVSSESGLWEYSLSRKLLRLDRQSYTVGGYGYEEFPPFLRDIHKRIHPEDKTEVLTYLISTIQQRKPLNIEFRFLHKKGTYIWIHLMGRVTLGRYLGLLRNISRRKQKEIYNNAVSQAQKYLLESGSWNSKAHYITHIVQTTLTTTSFVTLWELKPGFVCNGTCPLTEFCDKKGDCYHHTAQAGEKKDLIFKNNKRFPSRFTETILFNGKANSYSNNDIHDKGDLELFFDFGEGYYPTFSVYRLHDSDSKTLGLLMVNSQTPLSEMAEVFLENMADLCSQSLINALSLQELKQSRESILEKNKRLSLITQGINSSIDGVGISTLDGDLYYVNKRFLDLFKFQFNKNKTEAFKELFRNKEDYLNCLKLSREGKSERKETEMKKKDGQWITAAVRFSTFTDNETGDKSIIWNLTDITSQVQARIKIQKYTKTIEKDLKDKTELLRKAHLLQKQLIQRVFPLIDEFDLNALYMPCEDLGGDFFHIIRGLKKHKLALIMGDCTGHGVDASMESSLISSICLNNLNLLFNGNDTEAFLKKVNSEFGKLADKDQFPTMFAAVLDLDTKMLHYSNANSPLPYIYREGKILQLNQPGGLHFNINYFDDPDYERESFQFQKGDKMFIYSDAMLELDTEEETEKAAGALKETLLTMSKNNQAGFVEVLDYLNTKNGTLPLDDDSTLIEIDFQGIREKQFTFCSHEEWTVEFNKIRTLLTERKIPRDIREEIQICIDELCLNALNHGNRNNERSTILAGIKVSCRYVEFTVEDQGPGFDPEAVKDPSEDWEELMSIDDEEMMHGRGLWMVRNFSDVLEFNPAGNKAYMIKGLPARKLVQI